MYTAFRVVSVFSQSLLLLDGCKFIFARLVRAFFRLYMSIVRQGSVEILQKVVGGGRLGKVTSKAGFGVVALGLDFGALPSDLTKMGNIGGE
jgi:hypothetical protein